MSKVIDLTGELFGKWTVIRRLTNNIHGGTVWECSCECGVISEVRGNDLRSNKSKSCGCSQKEILTKLRFIDLTGQKFNKLQVLYQVDNHKGRTAYMCKCDCGTEKIITGKELKNGKTKSCGCYNLEKSKLAKYRRFNTYDLTGEYGIGYSSNGEEFYFDLEDYEKIKDHNWVVFQGYVSSDTYFRGNKLHRLIMNISDIDIEVDHISGVKYDNRKSNLRLVCKQQNMMNAKTRVDNKSGTKGVSWNTREQLWYSNINYKNKRYNLGLFSNIEDAIKIREIAELKLFAEYSRRYEELKEKYKDIDLNKYNF